MQTDFRAIQAIAQHHMGAFHISTVINKAGFLLNSVEAPQLTELISDLLYYVGNPELAKDLSKDDFVHMTSTALSLVNMMTDLRAQYADLTKHVEEVSHE